MLAVPAAAALLGVAVLVAGGLRPRLGGRATPARRVGFPGAGAGSSCLSAGASMWGTTWSTSRTSLAGLVALARQSGRIVLEVPEVGGPTWLVNGDDAVYRFRSAGPAFAEAGLATASLAEPPAATLDVTETGMLAAR